MRQLILKRSTFFAALVALPLATLPLTLPLWAQDTAQDTATAAQDDPTGMAQAPRSEDEIAADAEAADPRQEAQDKSRIVSFLEEKLSGKGRDIRISGFKGLLSSTATLESLTIADGQGTWLTLSGVTLDWDRSALLLRGRLDVQSLTADEIILARKPVAALTDAVPDAKATPFALPDLPVSVSIDELTAAKVTLGPTILDTPEDIVVALTGNAQLADGAGTAQLAINRIDGTVGSFQLAASYDDATTVADINLTVTEESGGVIASLANLPDSPSVDLTLTGSGPIDAFTADLDLSTNGAPRLQGAVTLGAQPYTGDDVTVAAGDPAPMTRTFTVDLGGDVTALFLTQYQDFFGPDVALTTTGSLYPNGALDLSALSLDARAITLEGTLSLGADKFPTAFDLDGRISSPDGSPVLLPLSGEPVRVQNVDLRALFEAGASEDWNADITVQGFERGAYSAAGATLTGRGTIARNGDVATQADGLTADVSFDLESLKTGDSDLDTALGETLKGTADIAWERGAPTDVKSLQVSAGNVRLTASATIGGLENGYPVSGNATLSAPDLTRFAAVADRPLAGAVTLALEGDAALLGGAFDLKATGTGTDLRTGIDQADNVLEGEAAFTVDAKRDETGTTLRQFDVTTPALTISANGDVDGDNIDVALDARLDDAARLSDQLQGPLTLTGTAARKDAGPYEVDLSAAGPYDAQASVIGSVSQEAIDVTIDAAMPDVSKVYPSAAGPLDVNGTIKRASATDPMDIDVTASGPYNATASVIGAVSSDKIDVQIAAALPDASRIVAQTTGPFALNGSVKREGAGPIEINMDANGPYAATTTVSGQIDGGDFNLDVDARLPELARVVPAVSGPLGVSGNVSRTGGGAFGVNVDLTGPAGTKAKVAGTLGADVSSADLAITGTAPLGLANRYTDTVSVTGAAAFNLRLDGPLALSSLAGTVNSSDARVTLPAMGYGFNFPSAQITLSGGRSTLNVTARSDDGGRFEVTGPLSLSNGFDSDLTIRLVRLRVQSEDLYVTRINGTLRLVGPLTGQPLLSGGLTLEETEVNISAPVGGGTVSIPDVVHAGETSAVDSTLARAGLVETDKTSGATTTTSSAGGIALRVRVSAPNQIFVRGRGLDAELGGSLQVTGTTANIVPVGQFNLVRGRLDILGNRLDLQTGNLVLQGNLDPTIYLQATTTTEDATITVTVSGSVSDPEIDFSSSPDLPDDEILARLIFGQALSDISPLQALQLAQAVATLTGNGGGLMNSIREQFDLDDLDVSTTDDGTLAVSAGKYLTDNVYTDVQLDAEGNTQINLNLDVTKDVTVKGGVKDSGETSLGVFFEQDY
ncbi:Translocation and assembly module TamB [Aquimixticola soesokkakensis]|uniref:Translocation and assembly module TamB n=1 Tax=Aquimixticola soesokkakensis TaxID=1519096 RepID=A0A1Y5S6P7_9RHOB|nr:translocation/assembly module TamB domain-containing protein [Aquimixticola soesokkakensis]SLN33180.1 Translocation and assembly module TamB [Aquimixticola soesokkakensis]